MVKGAREQLTRVSAILFDRCASGDGPTAVCVISGHVFPRDRATAMKAVCNVVLPKPCVPETPLAAVRRFSYIEHRETGSSRHDAPFPQWQQCVVYRQSVSFAMALRFSDRRRWR